MTSWKAYLLSETAGTFYLVRPEAVFGVRETADGHSVIMLANGSEVGVRQPAKAVMADIVPPPDPPLFVARLSPDNQTATFSGAADQGSVINIRDGAQLVATARTDVDQKWGTSVVLGLTPGDHSLVATQIDVFGRQSDPSPPCVLSIPEPPPPPDPEPAVEVADSGSGYTNPPPVTLVGGGAAEPAADGPVEIPDDWADQHHNTRIALAKRIAPDATVDTAAQADEIIAAEVERRQSAGTPAPQQSE